MVRCICTLCYMSAAGLSGAMSKWKDRVPMGSGFVLKNFVERMIQQIYDSHFPH
jgi:hypothetical protein